ncbi:hypothetical protein DH2020_032385 [Rehmannia glutinosa]|uniref:Uncharacterized protein n=1 Tax=Rehmannia glutinosa TaxID=99300 RepID=A0ABR0VIN2_REHGL
MGLKKGSTAAGPLPTTTTRGGRRRLHGSQKCSNQKLTTFLCCVITVLVFRGTIGITFLTPSPETRITRHVDQDTDRIVDEIRSDGHDDDGSDSDSDSLVASNDSYTLGPKISNWDGSRQRWLRENRGFPNYIDGKPRILLVTGSQPSPCSNPIGDHYLLKSIKNKIDYCRLHNIEIVYNLAHLDHELSGYWSKLPLIRRLMLSHPEMEWIWWMDSDAFFTDMRFEIPISKYNSVRDEVKILTANLKGRPLFEADDQSALIYLLISRKDEWMDKVFLENSYYLHGFWVGLVDRYEEYIEQYSPGFGDERWPFVTHFVGCKPCGGYGDYSFERCLKSMERAFNFADNQVLKLYGFGHRGLLSPNVKRIRNDTSRPLEIRDEFNVRT